MLKNSVKYLGNLICEVSDEDSGFQIKTDATGENKFVSPKSVLVMSLASCTTSMIAYFAMNHNLDVSGMEVETNVVVDETSHKITKFIFDITIPHALSEVEQKKLVAVAKTCPVGQMLDPKIEVEHHIKCVG